MWTNNIFDLDRYRDTFSVPTGTLSFTVYAVDAVAASIDLGTTNFLRVYDGYGGLLLCTYTQDTWSVVSSGRVRFTTDVFLAGSYYLEGYHVDDSTPSEDFLFASHFMNVTNRPEVEAVLLSVTNIAIVMGSLWEAQEDGGIQPKSMTDPSRVDPFWHYISNNAIAVRVY